MISVTAAAPFTQYESDRYQSSTILPTPPWPRLPFEPVQVVERHNASLAFAADGRLFRLQTDGTFTVVVGIPLLSPDARIALFASGAQGILGVVTCSNYCNWFHCISDVASVSCQLIAQTTGSTIGTVHSLLVTDTGTIFLAGSSIGLATATIESPSLIPFGRTVVGSGGSGGRNGSVTALALFEDTSAGEISLAVATDLAVYFDYDFESRDFLAHELVGANIDAPPTALAFVKPTTSLNTGDIRSTSGRRTVELWIGHEYCLNVIRVDYSVDRVSGTQGLPFGNITVLCAGSAPGQLWVGGAIGLALHCTIGCPDQWRFFGSDRFLARGPGVLSLALLPPLFPGNSPSAWVVTTGGGLARIWANQWTMEEKAALYAERIKALERYRYVAAVSLTKYGDLASVVASDGDNDGSFTALLVAAFTYEYAVTKSESARQRAWYYFSALEFLHNVTGTSGFFARTVVRCGDPHQDGDDPVTCPPPSPNSCGWVNSSACYAGVDVSDNSCCWVWKRDTSPDEADGHYQALLVVHRLLAQTDAERARPARLLCAAAAYLQDGGYDLIDPVTHRRTSWGYWSPAELNGVPGKPNERNENSLELLAYMAAAAMVCDATGLSQPPDRFGRAFADLVTNHGYDINAMNALALSPLSLAFFDLGMAMLCYIMLICAVPELMQTANPASVSPLIPLNNASSALFKQRLLVSIQRHMGIGAVGATVDGKNNRVLGTATVYQLMTNKDGLADPDFQMRRYPSNLIDWPVVNSRRLDVTLSPDWLNLPVGDSQQVIKEGVLPVDEALIYGSQDFLTMGSAGSVDGGSGYEEQVPNAWLFLYWFRRYSNCTD